ncbi:hypothetical protein IQ06DRAFT_95970 [Phaeosphaeriaceae sp. SRC1lsM3a]|nr:hypothetical protein IQ06DRAFT_95970 [Stagonospora sp. SRC1lsM3a]
MPAADQSLVSPFLVRLTRLGARVYWDSQRHTRLLTNRPPRVPVLHLHHASVHRACDFSRRHRHRDARSSPAGLHWTLLSVQLWSHWKELRQSPVRPLASHRSGFEERVHMQLWLRCS